MRQYLAVSHTTPPDGDWTLDDLAGQAGRVDVLCRIVTSALFVSHGIRDDTQVLLVFAADPDRPTAVRFEGRSVRRLNPDERSTAARIRKALRSRPEDPWWEEVEPGVHAAPFTLQEVVTEQREAGAHCVLLHRQGVAADKVSFPNDVLFLLSDHQPFSGAEEALLDPLAHQRASVGGRWYQGHQVVDHLQILIDGA